MTLPTLQWCRLAALLLIPSLAACAAARPAAAPASLAAGIDALLDAPPLQRTAWGVLVTDAASGAVLYQRNAERHFIPASNTKLVVSVTALGVLGPEWRYTTEVRSPAPDEAGAVSSLLLVGRGDPTLSARFWGREHAALEAIADSVRAAGVRRVAGPLVIDISRFPDAKVHSAWEVGDLPATYAAPVSAFAVEEGTFAVEVRGGTRAGSAALLAPLVPAHAAHIPAAQPVRSAVTTDSAGAGRRISTDYTARCDTLYLGGAVAAGAVDTLRLAVVDAARFAGRALAHELVRRGVPVDSVVVRTTAEPDPPPLRFVLTSPPLADVVAAILQPSQNWIAEQVLKTLGAEAGTAGSWSGGLVVERRYLAETAGIDTLAFNLRDASGLSAQNLLTPAATVRILAHARAAPWYPQFRSALAAPGMKGSTLENRLISLNGRLFAKTGTIANVNALSGYLTAENGRELTFSILSNGSGLPSATVRAAIDSVVQRVAREVR